MEEISLQAVVFVSALCLIVGLIIGLLIGLLVRKTQSVDHKQAVAKHKQYRDEVRSHFEQTSKIMSRMVDDYREMYQHVSKGAGELANIYPERVITPPPAPEAITEQAAEQKAADKTSATEEKSAAERPEEVPQQPVDYSLPKEDKESAAAGKDDKAAAQSSDKQSESIKERARRLSGNAQDKA